MRERPISQVAKLFINGRSQAVRLPAAYRFDTKEVYIRRDPETGVTRSIGPVVEQLEPAIQLRQVSVQAVRKRRGYPGPAGGSA